MLSGRAVLERDWMFWRGWVGVALGQKWLRAAVGVRHICTVRTNWSEQGFELGLSGVCCLPVEPQAQLVLTAALQGWLGSGIGFLTFSA